MVKELKLDHRLVLGPGVVGCIPNVVQDILAGLEQRLAKPQRGVPGLPFE